MEPLIRCSELSERLEDDDVLVVDCRCREDWTRYPIHIPGALWMTADELACEGQALPEDELIVLCGCAPDGSDARRAWDILQSTGREAVCLKGGLAAWFTGGHPVDEHEDEPLPSHGRMLVPTAHPEHG